MSEYRDYGTISGGTAPLVPINSVKRTQVFNATHEGNGERLPFMNRSFISFSYGGRYIEDFSLIATFTGNGINGNAYADFTDNVTESDIFDGQLYWSSHFKANTLTFNLSTDGMLEGSLDEFKSWFSPGKIRELILMERPNRAIMARVSKPPVYNLLPFEEHITKMIAGHSYSTSTTLYKGSITLDFVMDEPFWYSKTPLLCYEDSSGGIEPGYWVNANGEPQAILNDKDAIKIILEDHTAIVDQIIFDSSGEVTNDDLIVVGLPNIGVNLSHGPTGSFLADLLETEGAEVETGHVAFQMLHDIQYDLPANTPAYFYYGGTAPVFPVIKFTVIPTLSPTGFINSPCNVYSGEKDYNTITITSTEEKKLNFSLPGIWIGYNQAIALFTNIATDGSAAIEDVRQQIRENVKHFAARNYAIYVLNMAEGSSTTYTSTIQNNVLAAMPDFLKDSNGNFAPASFVIDNKDGSVMGTFIYRQATSGIQIITVEENASEMIKSHYLSIEERNNLTEEGYIGRWTSATPSASYKLTHDVEQGLINFAMSYQFMYY